MRLEYANIVCPKCGNGNYMRHMVAEKNEQKSAFDLKCINCNSYFKYSDVFESEETTQPKPTNADRVRSMTDEELAEWYWWMLKYVQFYTDSRIALIDWLKQEVSE